MRDPLDTLRGMGADRPTPTVADRRFENSEAETERWSEPAGPDWREQLQSTLLARTVRDWLPLVALGIIAMIGLVATTPEAYAERVPNAPLHGPNLRAAPHRR